MPKIIPANERKIRSMTTDKSIQCSIQGGGGLLLAVHPGGARTYMVRYRLWQGGKRVDRSYKIGDADVLGLGEAIVAAKELLTRVAQGEDPFTADSRRNEPKLATFGDLFRAWYTRHVTPNLARPKQEQERFDYHLKAKLDARPFVEITRGEIAQIRDTIRDERGPVASNGVVTMINRVYNWAIENDLAQANPAARLKKTKENPRERVLSEDEIGKLWRALDAMEVDTAGERMKKGVAGRMLSPATRNSIRLMLLTGQRRIEVAGIALVELQLDGDKPLWAIPGDRTKNGKLHRVPLSATAVAVIERAKTLANKVHLFPGVKGKPMREDSIRKALVRLCDEIGIHGVGPHDLRRTVGTELARLKVPENIRSLVLNHSRRSRSITDAVYNRYDHDDEKRDALEQWERRLLEIVSKPATNPHAEATTPPETAAGAG